MELSFIFKNFEWCVCTHHGRHLNDLYPLTSQITTRALVRLQPIAYMVIIAFWNPRAAND